MKLGKAIRNGWRLALPLAGMQLGYQMLSVVDIAILGHYDSSALAGVGIASAILNSILFFGTGLVMGLDTLIPQAAGVGNKTRARLLFDTGQRLALLLAIPLTLATALIPWIMNIAGVAPEAAAFAGPYVLARLPSLAPHLLFTAQRSYLQSHKSTRPLVLSMIAGNLVNIVFDWVLVFGDRGLVEVGLPPIGAPELGVIGAGIATTLVTLTSTAVGMYYTRDTTNRTRVWNPAYAVKIIRLGFPVGLQLLAEMGIFAIVAILAGVMGDFAAATHMVALALASASFSIALGIASATSVAVGHEVGRGDTPAARAAGWAGVSMGAIAMGIAGVLFLWIPDVLAAGFSKDAQVAAGAVPLVRIAAAFALSDAIQVAAAGALRGAGDTKSTFYGNLFGHYFVGLPVAMILGFKLNYGAAGLWWGLTAGLTLVAVALLVRFDRLARGHIAPQLDDEAEIS